MQGLIDEIVRWLEREQGPLGYVVLALSALIEYVVPPFPGDTVALFGVFLAVTAGWSALAVYLALNAGAIAGGMAAYGLGRAVARAGRRPSWLRGPRAERALRSLAERYRRHGAVYLALNRFVPALRAFFFVGAGIVGLPWRAVLLWGSVGAAAWNALLFLLGSWVGTEWSRLEGAVRTYGEVVLAAVGVAVVALGVRALVRRRAQ